MSTLNIEEKAQGREAGWTDCSKLQELNKDNKEQLNLIKKREEKRNFQFYIHEVLLHQPESSRTCFQNTFVHFLCNKKSKYVGPLSTLSNSSFNKTFPHAVVIDIQGFFFKGQFIMKELSILHNFVTNDVETYWVNSRHIYQRLLHKYDKSKRPFNTTLYNTDDIMKNTGMNFIYVIRILQYLSNTKMIIVKNVWLKKWLQKFILSKHISCLADYDGYLDKNMNSRWTYLRQKFGFNTRCTSSYEHKFCAQDNVVSLYNFININEIKKNHV